MDINESKLDRFLRSFAGLLIIGWGLYSQSWLGAFGIIPLTTGLVGWCPAYALFGFSTCESSES
ncbi:PF11127 family protein [Leptospira fainei serovar Hurstbridge str. BUT 6]|uniref:PF11127 family protein n=1 Tax=Leptospira fainei serovar Hurstbridge str. BUT 6 TaxID=1193011 RepID=S3UWL2_9LEPT|nr:DUF2892 domain-containing protein [Leptospira fainei]EPG73653.1 PF11127 family protein [Leptospira fainei serovar Hurstbridge str. BUT 6]